MKKKDKFVNIILIIMLFAGFSLLLYPSISDYWNSFHSSQAIAGYNENVNNLDKDGYEKIWNEAVEYNSKILERRNSYILSEAQKKKYYSLMNISNSGVIGYIEIPAINCMIPFYHGTEESVLSIAVGHLEWTSLPTGGESTHCVLSAHRGLPSAKLFTDLDRMEVGDLFKLHVLDKVLTYEVDRIFITQPQEVEELHIKQGEDLCTLITCTPYGINSHRLLVRGHRVENTDKTNVHITADAVKIDPVWSSAVIARTALLILFTATLLPKNFRGKGGKANEKK